ncbi:hypothetical protein [Natronococcus jeotgali]|uniref:hypothetical protein n=1 Tax=Natronococcus jeotgali TaxID=413812 RepID=UPI001267C29E|nr:hypothetical protein [Natronococcus jeotgali]
MSEKNKSSKLVDKLEELMSKNTEREDRQPPSRDHVQWMGSHYYIYDLEIVGQLGHVGSIYFYPNTLGWVISGLKGYIEKYGHDVVDIPSSYSEWTDDFGGDEGYYGEIVQHEDRVFQFVTPADRAVSALRALTDGDQYNSENYAFFSCTPVPILIGKEGAVAISPKEIELDSDASVDVIWTTNGQMPE